MAVDVAVAPLVPLNDIAIGVDDPDPSFFEPDRFVKHQEIPIRAAEVRFSFLTLSGDYCRRAATPRFGPNPFAGNGKAFALGVKAQEKFFCVKP